MGHLTIPVATIRELDKLVEADQGKTFRMWLQRVLPHIGDAYRQDEDGHRSHLGASQLGQECGRAVWYNFRWATKAPFPGRMLRLFNRGHLEEARFIALLLMLGCEVYQQDEHGKQFRMSFADGHAGGSGDGMVARFPELPPGTIGQCEFKTHNEKSFQALAGKLDEWRLYVEGKGRFTGKGLREAKFEHYVQMQLYMRKMGLAAGLYVAVNKNSDDIYMEIITLNAELADQFLARGETIVYLPNPPEKLSTTPGFWKCRFCNHNPVCHQRALPDQNCRTCRFSSPRPDGDGKWVCTNIVVETGPEGAVLSKERQLVGCSHYEAHKAYQ